MSVCDLPETMIERAFEIADTMMFALMEAETLSWDEYGNMRGLCNSDGAEVDSLAEASDAIRDAVEWLLPRGYVEVGCDADGEYIFVVKRPVERWNG